jgi:galactofuranose transport system ATP-binding protein
VTGAPNLPPILEARGVSRDFSGVRALDGVDFRLFPGEVHALMGENGAGKSTLIKVLTGVHAPDSGGMTLDGQPLRPSSPLDATLHGISTVYQEVNLAPNLSLAENICLGREPRGLGGIRWKEVRRRAEAAMARLGVHVDVTRAAGSCPIAIQQLAAIARALDVSCKVLILDEPTSSLDRSEVAQLFGVIRRLRDEGLAILFVTHFLDQVYEISDRITVLRNGKLVGERAVSELPRLELVSMMLGRDAAELESRQTRPATAAAGTPILQMEGVGKRGSVSDVSLSVGSGEVLGLAGLLGSGRTETIRLMYGLDTADTGRLRVRGVEERRYGVFRAIRRGLGLSPEDRKADGILPELSVRENLVLVLQGRRGWWRRLSRKEQDALAAEYIARLRIATSDAEKPIQLLSGGNQQKVLLARWLAANPALLLLDEPTRGIDVGAKFEIASLIDELREGGMAFVFVSSELDEVVRSSDRVAVFRDRRMVGEFAGDRLTEEALMGAIAGEDA